MACLIVDSMISLPSPYISPIKTWRLTMSKFSSADFNREAIFLGSCSFLCSLKASLVLLTAYSLDRGSLEDERALGDHQDRDEGKRICLDQHLNQNCK